MKTPGALVMMLGMGMGMGACASGPADRHTAGHAAGRAVILVKYQPDPDAIWLTVRAEGVITVRNGCVYILSGKRRVPMLAIWPASYELSMEEGRAVGIVDTLSKQSLKFNVPSAFGGGTVRDVPDALLAQPIPAECAGERFQAYFARR